ncbi:MAG: nicotinamide riboside transporter PnuC [Brevinema sp.]
MEKRIERIYVIVFGIFSFSVITYGSYIDYISVQNNLTLVEIIKLIIPYIAGLGGVLCVFLGARENIYNYLFGIISVSLWLLYITLWSPLMWDAFINIIYLVINFYGLYYWLSPNKNQQHLDTPTISIRSLTKKERIVYVIIAIVAIGILTIIGQNVGRYDSKLQALTDASSTIFALLGQWFFSLKVIESWYMWFIVNIISIPLYISIGSNTFASVWLVYLVNVIYGFIRWNYNMRASV